MEKKIAIVGAGALGGHVGAYLARDGRDVTLIDPWPEHVEHMRARGLTLEGQTEAECFTTPVNAIHITELQSTANGRPFDFAFVAMKSYDTVWATEMIRQYLAPGGFCVSLQNGINEERMAGVVGWGKTIGCIASTIAVELTEPGHIRRNVKLGGERHTVFRLGEVHGRVTARTQEIAAMLACVDSSTATDNLWGERWSKLVVNCMRNPVAAATGRGGNANDSDDHTRFLAIRLAGEAIEVGMALGFQLETVYGIAPEDILAATKGDAAALKRCEDRLFENMKHRSDKQRPSMGQDIAKRRRTEIDFINGLVVEKATDLGLSVPANEAIIEAVKTVERGDAPAGPERVEKI
ncbi:MAG: 2-dehydropantoate 2-reductase [Rhodospirillaceae bacterium]|nr:2-dehydropantoate 2-reductase [Rhodospirillaceae bacterium]